MINKVISRIVRWVDINHLHLTEIRLLKEFEYFEVVTLDIKILSIVPVNAIFLNWAKSLVCWAQNLGTCSLLANPVKRVCLGSILNRIIAKQLAQNLKIDGTFYPPETD